MRCYSIESGDTTLQVGDQWELGDVYLLAVDGRILSIRPRNTGGGGMETETSWKKSLTGGDNIPVCPYRPTPSVFRALSVDPFILLSATPALDTWRKQSEVARTISWWSGVELTARWTSWRRFGGPYAVVQIHHHPLGMTE